MELYYGKNIVNEKRIYRIQIFYSCKIAYF